MLPMGLRCPFNAPTTIRAVRSSDCATNAVKDQTAIPNGQYHCCRVGGRVVPDSAAIGERKLKPEKACHWRCTLFLPASIVLRSETDEEQPTNRRLRSGGTLTAHGFTKVVFEAVDCLCHLLVAITLIEFSGCHEHVGQFVQADERQMVVE